MRGRSFLPWLCVMASVMGWTLPALAADSNGVGGSSEGVLMERDDWLARTASMFQEPSELFVSSGYAHHEGGAAVHHRRRPQGRRSGHPESYMILKGGGLFVAEQDGLYFGIEAGGSFDDVVDFGISLDYHYRSSAEHISLGTTNFEDLPVEVVATLDESSAHLVPIGMTLRVRLPIGGEAFAPFISGTASYETLFLNNVGDPFADDPILRVLEQDERFSGFGWQAAAGMDMRLSPRFALFGEVGMHRSSPSLEILYDDVPVDLKVDLDGAFLRGGLRFRL